MLRKAGHEKILAHEDRFLCSEEFDLGFIYSHGKMKPNRKLDPFERNSIFFGHLEFAEEFLEEILSFLYIGLQLFWHK